ncbi:MAG: ribonuclease H-like domain-containing protein, partial [Leptospiraceae bacterium]|nr:ribonuclease H-like domain-containing protein [Leptospiraceae bacterium]
LCVSFNGSSFDIPILLKYFHLPEFPVPHVDLRWVLYHKGIRGGLKEIEAQLGIQRDSEVQGLNGMDAVFLWYRYNELGEKDAKDLLVKYCMADVISLKEIVDLVLRKTRNETDLIVKCNFVS